MKKLKTIFIVMLIFIGILLISSNVQAASNVKLEKLEVTSPASGTYKTGQEITIVATFSGEIDCKVEDAPYLFIKFGLASKTANTTSVGAKTITYKYKIEEDVTGTLELKEYSGRIKDKNGEYLEITAPKALSGSKISVNPLEWTDTSKAKIEVKSNNEQYATYSVNITGIKTMEKHGYYVYVSNSKEAKMEVDSSGMPTNANNSTIRRNYTKCSNK